MKKLLYLSILVAVISAPADGSVTAPTAKMTNAESQWHNLDGKMITISKVYSGVSFFPPYKPGLPAITAQYSTPAPTTAGISVCLRYIVDRGRQYSTPNIFTLNPSSRDFLRLSIVGTDRYQMFVSGYSRYYMDLTTDLVLWPTVAGSLWTRICLTVDSRKNVVQMFSGRQISIRKILPRSYILSGKPVIQFSGFDGQVTDVQMWDYPLSYKEVFAYMNFPRFRPAGSVLKWSHISYSGSGDVLVEDTYENQAKQPFRGKLGKKRKRMFSSMVQPKKTINQQC